MWELDHKEGWAPKNGCFRTVVLEKILEHPLDFKDNKSVSCKGNQPWIFTARTDAKAEAPILWPPDLKRLTNWKKNPDAGKEWRQKEMGAAEDEMVGWHHQPNSKRHWRTGEPGVLQSIGSQRVGHDLVTKQQQYYFFTDLLRDSIPYSTGLWTINSINHSSPQWTCVR